PPAPGGAGGAEADPADQLARPGPGPGRPEGQRAAGLTMAIRLAECRSNLTSQSGENGVVDAILGAIGIAHRIAVEFGAYHLYEYSNIAPLWRDRGWRAVLIE